MNLNEGLKQQLDGMKLELSKTRSDVATVQMKYTNINAEYANLITKYEVRRLFGFELTVETCRFSVSRATVRTSRRGQEPTDRATAQSRATESERARASPEQQGSVPRGSSRLSVSVVLRCIDWTFASPRLQRTAPSDDETKGTAGNEDHGAVQEHADS